LYKSSLSTRVVDTTTATTTTTADSGNKAKKYAYRPIDLTNLPSPVLASHVNYFLEPLYCAERCWAASLALKAEMNSVVDTNDTAGKEGNLSGLGGDNGLNNNNNPRKDWSVGKFRAQSMKRLKKAVKYAELLETLALSTKPVPKADNDDAEEEKGDAQDESVVQQPPVDEHTQMEARAYASFMRGNLALEMNQWQVACTQYQMAMQLCEALGQGIVASANAANAAAGNCDGSTSGTGGGNDVNVQQLELFDFFNSRAKNVIAPLLKYCHYELQEKGLSPTEKISFLQSSSSIISGDGDPLQSKLHSLKNETLQTQATSGSSMSQIRFRETVVPVETKDLRMALLKIQDLKSDWEEKERRGKQNNNNTGSRSEGNGGDDDDDAKFMELLSGYDDAVSLVNKELKQLAALKSGPAVNAKKFQLVNLLGYSKYQKLKLVMGRNEELTNGIIQKSKEGDDDEGMTLKHLEEVAHLYDALLQDARAVASLPGGGSPDDFDGETTTSSSAVVEDEFYLEANANVLRLRSLRCYYLARMHASPLVHKYSEAVALLDQAERLANEALEEIGACDQMENGDALLESLEEVAAEMRGEKCRVLALSYLSKSSSTGSGKCLMQRLHDYNIPSSPKSIAHVPPKLEPMACKPSFFDVALNYVSEYPVDELERAMEEYNGVEAASSGILGWFRRG